MTALARVAEISSRFRFCRNFCVLTTLVSLITESLLSSDDAASLDFLFAHLVMQLVIAKFLAFATIFFQNRGFAMMFFSCTDDPELFS